MKEHSSSAQKNQIPVIQKNTNENDASFNNIQEEWEKVKDF